MRLLYSFCVCRVIAFNDSFVFISFNVSNSFLNSIAVRGSIYKIEVFFPKSVAIYLSFFDLIRFHFSSDSSATSILKMIVDFL